jgi:hypothetical protein
MVGIEDQRLIAGSPPPRVLGLVAEWASLYRPSSERPGVWLWWERPQPESSRYRDSAQQCTAADQGRG